MGHLQRVGALSNMPIAKTIQYAMGITELLDEKYLWVNNLCILQDDVSQKHIEMSKMAVIYANSAVAILAVEGRHANSGLKGFHGISEARNLCQSFHRLAEGTKIILFPMGLNQLELGTHQTDWEIRGWTYQEHFFSLKRLVFDGDSVDGNVQLRSGVSTSNRIRISSYNSMMLSPAKLYLGLHFRILVGLIRFYGITTEEISLTQRMLSSPLMELRF